VLVIGAGVMRICTWALDIENLPQQVQGFWHQAPSRQKLVDQQLQQLIHGTIFDGILATPAEQQHCSLQR